MAEIGPRLLPAPDRAKARCQYCKRPIVWAVTVAGPNGPGGKAQPFDPLEDPRGNVAVWNPHQSRLLARALSAGEKVDTRLGEFLAMPHAASCNPTASDTQAPPPGVISLDEHRRKRRSRSAR